ncbi:DUF924 domain-containing protein [filamentous cyanobacterium CCP2]|nr:DUF924 domain-containing protein [filamentous cyanobacterium CCP2]
MQPEEILQFWFPIQSDVDPATLVRQWEWWFRGEADADIIKHFSPVLEQAIAGELNDWSQEPRSRLALILVLDQFSRSIYRGTAQAFAQDPKASQLALEGIAIGHYAALETPWEKTFFVLPLGHSEDLRNLELVVELTDAIVQETPQMHQELLAFSAEQAHRQHAVIARFGRHPHRNKILGRHSTPEELEYLATGQLVHKRSLPPHLSQLSSKGERLEKLK